MNYGIITWFKDRIAKLTKENNFYEKTDNQITWFTCENLASGQNFIILLKLCLHFSRIMHSNIFYKSFHHKESQ